MALKHVSTFYPTFDPVPAEVQDPVALEHAGQTFTVIGPSTVPSSDAEIVHSAYDVQFADGRILMAWTEEISPEVTVDVDFTGKPWQHRDAPRADPSARRRLEC